MVKTQSERTAIASSVQRAAGWIVGLQKGDGSLRNADHLGYYYKVPFALTVAGFNVEAEHLLNYVPGFS